MKHAKTKSLHNTPSDTPLLESSQKCLCLVQLARIGDILQVYQACRDIKRQSPELRLILIARDKFARDLLFLLSEVFDKVYLISIENFIGNSLTKSIDNTNLLLDKLRGEKIDALVNLTYSKSSGYLCSLIPAKHKLGPFRDHYNKITITDIWSQYLYSNVLETSLNPFHLTDLFKYIIGVDSTSGTLVQEIGYASRDKKVVIHPFASSDRKKWKIQKWIEVAYHIQKYHSTHEIFIVGAKNEQEEIDTILSSPLLSNQRTRISGFIGKSLSDLHSLLKKSCLFIGHDSMVGHMAALTDTPSITISLGSVRLEETTPYLNGSLVLSPRINCFPCRPQTKCQLYECHQNISYQSLNFIISEYLTNGRLDYETFQKKVHIFHRNKLFVSRSEFTQTGHFQLTHLQAEELTTDQIFRTFYRIIWSFCLRREEERSPLPKLNKEQFQQLNRTLESINHLQKLCTFGKNYSQQIIEEVAKETPKITQIKALSQKIDEVDNLCSLLQKTDKYLKPITLFLKVRLAGGIEQNIVQMAEKSFYIFNDSMSQALILQELIEKSIAPYKEIYVLPTAPIDTQNKGNA